MGQRFNFSFDSRACDSCGARCCLGAEGYVFASIAELKAISDFLNMPFETFTLRYVRQVGNAYSLLEKRALLSSGHACVFLDEPTKRCTIYPVRPKQCQTFPFWECFKTNHEKLLTLCPGVRMD
ncbi:hypothetical protein HBZS_122500 [Helicobacter bizzozeronii CCUG 35545]|nr:hypothetical protein HBZS_122500 [Helicobacter bizzozeronii CCUG 35545]